MTNEIKSFHDRVSAYMKHTCQVDTCTRILVGVSGGIDSVILLDVLGSLGYKCEVIHINFQLRGSDSDGDEKFVRDLCTRRQLKFHAHQASAHLHAEDTDQSVQMAAREIRYSLFAQTASEHQITTVAVGHHGDDQSESLLINLNRGTGLEGIAGMRPVRPLNEQHDLIRPLLAETRASIHAYADARHLSWREDLSNQNEKYLRSRIRSKVMPHLNSSALARSSNIARQWIDQVIIPMIAEAFAAASEGRSLNITYLKQVPSVLAQRLVIEGVRRWIPCAPADETAAKRIMSLIDLQAGKRIQLGGGEVWRDRNHLTFSDSISHKPMKRAKLFADSSPVAIPGGQLRLDLSHTKPTHPLLDPDEAWLDADMLTIPLMVRNWRPGDRIRPLGMEGTKKVSDLLTDISVPASKRKDAIVVCSKREIVWVVGYRLSHTFRILHSTRNYAQLCFERV